MASSTTDSASTPPAPPPPTSNPLPSSSIPNPNPQILNTSPLPNMPSINQPLAVKLDDHNYIIWKEQLLNIVIANGLEEFLDGSRVCPPRFLDPQQQQSNPEFHSWQRYNRLVMSWIYASINESMLGQIVGYTSASQIWEALERLYAAASFAHLTELRTALQTIKKEGLTALAYIQKFRHLCNSLASIGEPVTYTDHLIYFLGGLGRDYNPFVTSIQSQAIRPSIEEVHSLLLSYDARLERQSATDT
ncbi:hypothetical protein Acr_04g0001400 [Actinidia rufa]|uniref:Retrotransposon Copia-like N-terminal domain-containing protein n=1 Tax=Actinidia rufa TaxID=165716 RepID=A0A7J0EGI5_9ERIC|nr:hypothetical protein Acr_04g0001400 [Actinidia rufa]